jgi:hypothetical protein
MIQVYVPVRQSRRITIPLVAFQELDIGDCHWLRLSVIEPGRALLERVSPEVPETEIVRGAAAIGATLGAGAPAGGSSE